MIYATPFDPKTKECTARSTASGFESLAHVRAAMGEPKYATTAFLIYPGDVIFSKIPWNLDE